MMRIPELREISVSCRWSSAPPSPASVNPSESTMAALTPPVAHFWTISGIVGGGVITTARSTASPTSLISAYDFRPSTSPYFEGLGLDGVYITAETEVEHIPDHPVGGSRYLSQGTEDGYTAGIKERVQARSACLVQLSQPPRPDGPPERQGFVARTAAGGAT
jgi:hypothetical protein